MRRRAFLGGAVGLFAGLYGGRLPNELAPPAADYVAGPATTMVFGSPEQLVASGGLCAPVTPYYEICNLTITRRPIAEALPSFSAKRGSVG